MSAIEVVKFKVRNGVGHDQVVSASNAVTSRLKSYAGFESRDLAISEHGVFIDIVHWATLDDAQAAAKEVMADPVCGEFFSLLDESSIEMEHYERA